MSSQHGGARVGASGGDASSARASGPPAVQRAQRAVWLGEPGEYTAAARECTHYDTKVGGEPCFPGTAVPAGAPPTCGVCQRRLALVLQAYAPLNKAEHGVEATERCLYLFACVEPSCAGDARAWKAFRAQLHPPEAHSADAGQQPQGNSSAPAAAPRSSGQQEEGLTAGYGGCRFGDEDDPFGDGGDAGDALDFAALNAALDSSTQQLQQSSGRAAQPRGEPDPRPPDDAAGRAGPQPTCWQDTDRGGPAGTAPALPEFYIVAREELSGGAMDRAEAQHIQELLHRYQLEEREHGGAADDPDVGAAVAAAAGAEDDEDGDTASAAASDHGSQGGGATAGAASSSSGGWAPEEYEEDEVRGVEASYLKFGARLGRHADQCVRYSWDGPLLWPKKQPPGAGACARCGAPCVFEMQLMAPVIAFMLEAADLLRAAAADDNGAAGASSSSSARPVAAGAPPHGVRVTDPAALMAAANWELCTAAVFTCARACCGGHPGADGAARCEWVEERVVIINESECHLPMP